MKSALVHGLDQSHIAAAHAISLTNLNTVRHLAWQWHNGPLSVLAERVLRIMHLAAEVVGNAVGANLGAASLLEIVLVTCAM